MFQGFYPIVHIFVTPLHDEFLCIGKFRAFEFALQTATIHVFRETKIQTIHRRKGLSLNIFLEVLSMVSIPSDRPRPVEDKTTNKNMEGSRAAGGRGYCEARKSPYSV